MVCVCEPKTHRIAQRRLARGNLCAGRVGGIAVDLHNYSFLSPRDDAEKAIRLWPLRARREQRIALRHQGLSTHNARSRQTKSERLLRSLTKPLLPADAAIKAVFCVCRHDGDANSNSSVSALAGALQRCVGSSDEI
jgi:hypothetical protein